jgi:hypothetical protein
VVRIVLEQGKQILHAGQPHFGRLGLKFLHHGVVGFDGRDFSSLWELGKVEFRLADRFLVEGIGIVASHGDFVQRLSGPNRQIVNLSRPSTYVLLGWVFLFGNFGRLADWCSPRRRRSIVF